MAENRPPADVPPMPATALADRCGSQREPVEPAVAADASTVVDGKLLARLTESERKMQVSAEMKSAEANQLLEKTWGKAAGKKAKKSSLSTQLQRQKDAAKKELDAAKEKLAWANLILNEMRDEATLLLAKTKDERSSLSSQLKLQKNLAKRELAAETANKEPKMQLKKDASPPSKSVTDKMQGRSGTELVESRGTKPLRCVTDGCWV